MDKNDLKILEINNKNNLYYLLVNDYKNTFINVPTVKIDGGYYGFLNGSFYCDEDFIVKKKVVDLVDSPDDFELVFKDDHFYFTMTEENHIKLTNNLALFADTATETYLMYGDYRYKKDPNFNKENKINSKIIGFNK